MKIGWFQYDIKWKDCMANLSKIKEALQSCKELFDILVLPEMFDTGFVLEPQSIENRNQTEVLKRMQEISITYKIEIFLSMIWKENNCFTNRAFYINGDDFTYYDKVHLFAPGGESLNFKAGEERKVIKTVKGISILPLICYDLRFPEISRNKGDIDVIIYMSSWPETRTYHWDTLLKARAIENQCYVLGVNRIGKDGNQLNYIGHSNLIDYYGNEVAIIRNNENSRQKISIAHLDFHKMYAYRNKLPFLRDIM